MAAVFAFLGMLLLSLVVALLAALQLGDFFRAGEEFVPILTVIAIFAAAAIVVFAIAHAVAKRLRAINAIAAALSLLALALVALPSLVERLAERLSDPFAVAPGSTAVALVLLVPLLLVVLVQWGLVRRRWLRAAGEEDLSHWPWVTTAIAGLSILNPFGLALVTSALQRSASDFMAPYFTTVAAAVIAALVVMAAAECYIRGRILRRRLAASQPPKGGEVATPP